MNITNELKKVLNKYNIKSDDKIVENIDNFNNLMLEYNKTHNLTSITEKNEIIYKHYLDSLLGLNLIENNSKVIDLGCGGGFPSIPLKIANNTLNFTAVDSVGKKTKFVEYAKNQLNLDNFNVINSRIEDLAFKSEYREKYDIVVSRAVASLPTIIEYSAPFLKNNGTIICYKGINYLDEIKLSDNALKQLNCKIVDIKEYYIEEINQKRYFIIIKKFETISNQYPRKQNKPRLQPL